ncbi:MAG: hypothetical protein ABI865_10875 [Nitrosospira sp.]
MRISSTPVAANSSIPMLPSRYSHPAFLTHEALNQIACVTTGNLLRLETGEPFLEGTTL